MCRLHDNGDPPGVILEGPTDYEHLNIPMEYDSGAVSICAKCGAQNITQMCPGCFDHADDRNDGIWDAVVSIARGTCIVLALTVGAAHAQTQPPAQAQAAAAAPAQPGDPLLDQADADLRALVASINARLTAINDDMTALRERAKPKTPTPAAPTGAPQR